MSKRYPIAGRKSQQGAVLLESLIAVLIFSFGVLALAGLQSAMIQNTDNAKYRAEATFIAQQMLGKIWTNADGHANLASYAGNTAVALLPAGQAATAVDPTGLVTITVTWTPPGADNAHNYTAMARIEGI